MFGFWKYRTPKYIKHSSESHPNELIAHAISMDEKKEKEAAAKLQLAQPSIVLNVIFELDFMLPFWGCSSLVNWFSGEPVDQRGGEDRGRWSCNGGVAKSGMGGFGNNGCPMYRNISNLGGFDCEFGGRVYCSGSVGRCGYLRCCEDGNGRPRTVYFKGLNLNIRI